LLDGDYRIHRNINPYKLASRVMLAAVLITTLLVSLDIIRIAIKAAQKHAETGWRE